MKRENRGVRYPYVVRLPKGATAVNSSHRTFDIVQQELVVNTWIDSPYVVRSMAPFVLRANVNGKIREFISKRT
jgi:hypothetical protein